MCAVRVFLENCINGGGERNHPQRGTAPCSWLGPRCIRKTEEGSLLVLFLLRSYGASLLLFCTSELQDLYFWTPGLTLAVLQDREALVVL
jgi:hypothetical protein